MLAKFLVRAVFAALGLWAASAIVPGVNVSNTGTLILAAILLGVVNALVRPVLVILTLPLTILTLGLFVFIVNAAMLMLTSWISEKVGLAFSVDEFFWDAVLGALIITVVSMVLSVFDPSDK